MKQGQHTYLPAEFSNVPKNEVNENRVSYNIFKEENANTPVTKQEFKDAMKELDIESEKYTEYIDKIDIQIQNIKSNNTDYRKKNTSLVDNSAKSKSSSLKLQGLLVVATFGLLFGSWLSKILY